MDSSSAFPQQRAWHRSASRGQSRRRSRRRCQRGGRTAPSAVTTRPRQAGPSATAEAYIVRFRNSFLIKSRCVPPHCTTRSIASSHAGGCWESGAMGGRSADRLGREEVYGARLGILMLRRGSGASPAIWAMPKFRVLYKVVPGASPQRVVHDKAAGLLGAFLDATWCGRPTASPTIAGLCHCFQPDHRRRRRRAGGDLEPNADPVHERLLPPGRRVGAPTVNAASLTSDHLSAAGADPNTPVVGTLGDEERLDVRVRPNADILGGAIHPARYRAVVSQCTNMCRMRGHCASGCGCRYSISTPL